jgi:hypothetical protein
VVPQIWTYEHTLAGGQPARAFVWMQGHEYANFANYQIQQMLLRGIAWAAHKPVDTLVDYLPPPSNARRDNGLADCCEAVCVICPQCLSLLAAISPSNRRR